VIAVGLVEKAETDYGEITESVQIIKEDASPRVRACSARQDGYTVLRERAHGGNIGDEAHRFENEEFGEWFSMSGVEAREDMTDKLRIDIHSLPPRRFL